MARTISVEVDEGLRDALVDEKDRVNATWREFLAAVALDPPSDAALLDAVAADGDFDAIEEAGDGASPAAPTPAPQNAASDDPATDGGVDVGAAPAPTTTASGAVAGADVVHVHHHHHGAGTGGGGAPATTTAPPSSGGGTGEGGLDADHGGASAGTASSGADAAGWAAGLDERVVGAVEEVAEELAECSGPKGPGHLELMLGFDVELVEDHLADHPLVEERPGDRWEYVGD